jgi:hypothetical protein
MAAPIGNRFWELAENAGRPKAYKPEKLWEEAKKYFVWCEDNPWQKNEALKGGDFAGQIIKIPTSRPFTISGLCVFLGITTQTYDSYQRTEEFLSVTTRIHDIIYTNKFEGAAVGAYNANIIARDLGLADKSDIKAEVTGSMTFNGSEIVRPNDPNEKV